MRYAAIVAGVLTVALVGCSSPVPKISSSIQADLLSGIQSALAPTPKEHVSEVDLDGGEPSAYDQLQKEEASSVSGAQQGQKCDIRFVYRNDFYGYDLEATWSGVTIKKTNTNLSAEIYGLELLFDGTNQLFDEMDADDSGNLDANEWTEIEPDFPLKNYDANKNNRLDLTEFINFAQRLGGIDAYPTGFTITQPTMENHALELSNDDPPVSIKILRASTGGFTGGYGYYFPMGTVFVELATDYTIFIPEAGDMVVTSAFDYPLLNMYVDDKKEVKDSYSHGAIGFSSVVDTNEFNGIFSGKRFLLEYEAYYDGKVVGTYNLTITPK